MRIHWNYGMMANAFYGCRIQKLTEKDFQIFISHLALTLIMSIGKSVSSFRVLSKEEGDLSQKLEGLRSLFSGPSTFLTGYFGLVGLSRSTKS